MISKDPTGEYAQIWQEDDDTAWICPNMTETVIKDNEYLAMFVTTCESAGPQPYSNEECS